MKRLLLLLAFLVFYTFGLVAQTYSYRPLVDTTTRKEWNYTCNWSYGAQGGGTIYEDPDVLMADDTLMNGFVYRKISSVWGYLGAVIEDTSKKVFLKPAGDTSSSIGELIFNFALNVNDTFVSAQIPFQGFKLQSIDTVLVGSVLRRRFTFPIPGNATEVWVEGIGSLLYGIYYEPECFFYTFRLCRERENGNIIYSNSDCYTGMELVNHDNLNIHLYPNPISDKCTIKFDNYGAVLSASVWDLTGREIMPLFRDQNILTYTMDSSPLTPGVYLIRVNSSTGKNGVVKLIKE